MNNETNLGYFSILESLFYSDGVPIDVGFVSGVFDDGVEEHGL